MLCYQICDCQHDSEQKEKIKEFPQSYRLYGTVVSGKGATGYNVSYDLMPAGHKIVHGLMRAKLVVLAPREDEIPMQQNAATAALLGEIGSDDDEEVEEEVAEGVSTTKKKKPTPLQQSVKDFMSQMTKEIATAALYEMKWGKLQHEVIEWEILADGVDITDNPMVYPEEIHMKKEIDFGSEPLDEIFFNHFFPCIEGHAKKLDDFFKSPAALYHSTVRDDDILFHQPKDDDPDWVVKQCHLLLTASLTETVQGVDNVWMRGCSGGGHNHSDFGQYVSQNMFKAFMVGAPMMFAEKKWWYEDDQDKDWEIFLPVIQSFNEKCRALFACVLLMLDESMSARRPKNLKTGGLPNVSYEPRKPTPLGKMLRNGVECLSGCLALQDVVVGAERQQMKPHFFSDFETSTKAKSQLPNKSDVLAPTVEVLRQAEGAELHPRGWCGGDAWFGSVQAAVELKLRHGVYSTFVVKNNKQLFPMEILHAVMKARHGKRPAGHWVVMRTVISGVRLIAIAYAWNQKGLAYFISTCGKTTTSPHKYESKFQLKTNGATQPMS